MDSRQQGIDTILEGGWGSPSPNPSQQRGARKRLEKGVPGGTCRIDPQDHPPPHFLLTTLLPIPIIHQIAKLNLARCKLKWKTVSTMLGMLTKIQPKTHSRLDDGKASSPKRDPLWGHSLPGFLACLHQPCSSQHSLYLTQLSPSIRGLLWCLRLMLR